MLDIIAKEVVIIDYINESQLRKGIVEGFLLMIIGQSVDLYGYEISQKFADIGVDDVSMGTIYPILTKFEKNNWVTTETRKSDEGSSRKYYALSKDGKLAKTDFISRFGTYIDIFESLR
ncbi:PadR family transcriptional regulator [Lactococcus laudensis]|uniref:PadR family transcriptional regulator n=1 Tax=Pseudolactococcus laudensis TaxID=1494461 RepID=UPI0012DDFA9D